MARRAELVAMGVPAADLDALARRGTARGGRLAGAIPGTRSELAAGLAAAVAAHDAADPLDPGLPWRPPAAPSSCPSRGWSRPAAATPARGPSWRCATGGCVRSGGRRAARRRPRSDGRAARRSGARALRRPRGRPARRAGLGPRQLASLVRAGELLRIADGVRAAARAPTPGRWRCSPGSAPSSRLSAARQALGTSRRVAVPLLELLARTGRTVRTADGGHRLV